jgi:rare lipoprotein A
MLKRFTILLSLTTTLILTGCATTEPVSERVFSASDGYEDVDVSKIQDPVPIHEPKSKYGNPESYQVFGKTYYIKDSAHEFKERGLASWYGHPFHGRRTSSGEPYDMYKMTAAHKEVPIPCYMRVTNLETGKSIIVRVNDRGPFHDARVIDLSYVAAKKLGVHAKGTLPVEIEVVTPQHDSGPAVIVAQAPQMVTPVQTQKLPPVKNLATTNTNQSTYLQVASFSTETRAQEVATSLKQLYGTHHVNIETAYQTSGQPVYRVRVGPFAHHSHAEQYSANVQRIYPDTSPVIIKD